MATAPIRIEFSARGAPAQVVRAIRDHLSSRGLDLSLETARHAVGRMFGYSGWGDLIDATGHRDSPADHLVAPDERRARLMQYLAALSDAGIPEALAAETVAKVSPTAPVVHGGEISNFLRRAHPGLRDADADAFGDSPGGARLLRALASCVADDPHWVARGASRLRSPCDAWLVRALSGLRDDPAHPGWPSLALAAAAEVSMIVSDAHPFCGALARSFRDAVEAGDTAACAEALAAAGDTAFLSFVAHVEDILSAQVGRASPNRALLKGLVINVPPVRPRWRPSLPFDLRGDASADPFPVTTGTVTEAGVDIAEDAPPRLMARITSRAECPEWAFLCDGTAVPVPHACGPLERDEVILISSDDGSPLCGAVVRHRAEPANRLHRVTVEGPRHFGDAADAARRAAGEAYLVAVAAMSAAGDARSWGRLVAPGGRLDVSVGPAGTAGSPWMIRTLARVIGDLHLRGQDNVCDLGYDLVVGLGGPDGFPRPLPALHSVPVPARAAEGWSGFLGAFQALNEAGVATVLASFWPSYALTDGDLTDLDDIEGAEPALAVMVSEDCESAVRALIMEAGLGKDAVLAVRHDMAVVVARSSLSNRDWSGGFGACLVAEPDIGVGTRSALVHRFWHGFSSELDAVLESRAGLGTGQAGSTSRH